ncbi:MAG: hypothetical protein AAF479_11665 [Pseudomonadota bacterium]
MIKRTECFRRTGIGACLIVAAALAVVPVSAQSDAAQRVVVLREGATLTLLDQAFAMKLLKIRGYSVDVRIDGARRTLKKGDTFSPNDGGCFITFRKISPETRIARFGTDCPDQVDANG